MSESNAARAALVERMATVCGGNYVAANAALGIVLEEAARVVDNMSRVRSKDERERIYKIATAIRAMIKENS